MTANDLENAYDDFRRECKKRFLSAYYGWTDAEENACRAAFDAGDGPALTVHRLNQAYIARRKEMFGNNG